MVREQKKGQLNLSFGMIFSILLIIAFVAFAFYGIKLFLGVQKNAEAGKFLTDFRDDINRVWKSAQSSEKKEYFLTKAISDVCVVDFASPARGQDLVLFNELKRLNYGSENFVFYPVGELDIDSVHIENIDLGAITLTDNPYCLENVDGKIQLVLVKDLNASQVTIRR